MTFQKKLPISLYLTALVAFSSLTVSAVNGFYISSGQKQQRHKSGGFHPLTSPAAPVPKSRPRNNRVVLQLPQRRRVSRLVGAAGSTAADFDSSSSSARTEDSSILLKHEIPVNGELFAQQDYEESVAASNKSKKPPFPIVLWRFTRPHTLIGSALAIPAIHLLAAPSWSVFASTSLLYRSFLPSIMTAMVPSLLMNLYITGLNQITDVEIDKINKPDLPIAAGMLQQQTAIAIVVVSLILSLTMGQLWGTPGLKFCLWGSAVLGTLYSLPPVRLKRFPLLAAFCIVAVRGTVINAGFFAHAKAAAFGTRQGMGVWQTLLTDRACALSTLFFCVFGIVIALMKDVPDVLGDETSNVRTLSVRMGPKQVFHASRRILTALFGCFGVGLLHNAMLQQLTTSSSSLVVPAVTRGLTGLASLWAAWTVRKQAQEVNPEESDQVYSYYMYLWKLFYLSYLVLPFTR